MVHNCFRPAHPTSEINARDERRGNTGDELLAQGLNCYLADTPATQPSDTKDMCPFWGSGEFLSLSADIAASIGVYRCTVTQTKKFPTPADAEKTYGEAPEFGEVHLDVVETFHGEPVKQLKLPYALRDYSTGITQFRRPFAIGTVLWPYPAFAEPRPSLCIIVGKPESGESYGGVPLNGKVAHHVYVGKNSKTDFAWMRDLCQLMTTSRENPEKRLAKLAEAATAENEEIRRYSVEAMMKEFSETSPEVVTAAVLRQFDRATELKLEKTNELRGTLSALARVADDRRVDQRVRRMATRTLVLCACHAKPDAIRQEALHWLKNAVTDGYGLHMPYKPSAVLSAAELADLRALLDAQLAKAKFHPDAFPVQHWIDVGAAEPQ
jgi:hypothetical protein